MFNTTITKYYTANGLDKLIQDIEKNSIGMEDWFHRVGSLHETSTNYPPYNLIKESSTEFERGIKDFSFLVLKVAIILIVFIFLTNVFLKNTSDINDLLK